MDEPGQALRRLVDQIVAAVHPLRIILFGWAARGGAHHDSDLDVLVVMPEGTAGLETARELYRRIRGVGVAFDILVATPAIIERHGDNPGLIYRTILREGRTVYAA